MKRIKQIKSTVLTTNSGRRLAVPKTWPRKTSTSLGTGATCLYSYFYLWQKFLGQEHEDTELTFKTLENVEAGLGQSSLSQVAGGAAGVVKVDKESGEEVAKNKMTMIMIV